MEKQLTSEELQQVKKSTRTNPTSYYAVRCFRN